MLKPSGRFAVSDKIFLGDKSKLAAEVIRSVEMWAGCVSGALGKPEYEALLRKAGFEGVSVEVTRTYGPGATAACCGVAGTPAALREVPLASAFIRARKPVAE